MSSPGGGYLEVLDKWIYNGYTTLNSIGMSSRQKLRTQIVWEVYQVWLQNKQINPMDLCRKVSHRLYKQLLDKSSYDADTKAFLEDAGIREGSVRTPSELSKDVATLNHIIATFTAPTADIEKAKVVDASDWLIQHGKRTGDGRDVAKGADLKMRLHKDFDAKEAGYEDMANTDISITSDVSVVKPGRTNYTDEQKKALAKQYNITVNEVVTLEQNADGVWEETT